MYMYHKTNLYLFQNDRVNGCRILPRDTFEYRERRIARALKT